MCPSVAPFEDDGKELRGKSLSHHQMQHTSVSTYTSEQSQCALILIKYALCQVCTMINVEFPPSSCDQSGGLDGFDNLISCFSCYICLM